MDAGAVEQDRVKRKKQRVSRCLPWSLHAIHGVENRVCIDQQSSR